MEPDSSVERWATSGAGRSRSVATAGLVWTVANAVPNSAPFLEQAAAALYVLDARLIESGSRRGLLLSVQVILTDMRDREAFDLLWLNWIGSDPAGWPQRSCIAAGLAPGLRIELVAVAARDSASAPPAATAPPAASAPQ